MLVIQQQLNYKNSINQYHFEFLQYKLMSYILPILISLLLVASNTQSNVCYANCKKGYCTATNANNCTDCDLGMLNINNTCVTTNIQPNPITYLKPTNNNTQLDNNIFLSLTCNINTQSGTTKMLFQPQIGSSYTQQFDIPVDYSYLRIKFNSIMLTTSTVTQPISVLVNIVPADNRRAFIFSRTQSINPNNLSLSCNSFIRNINNYYGVFYMDYKVSNRNRSIILEVIPQGLVNAYIAVSNVEIYYGNCDRTCGTCEGPTSSDCTSCKGLLLTLQNSSCVNCPSGFYQNITCYPCPQLCQTCTYSNKKVTCLTCRGTGLFQVKLTNGTCNITQFYKSSLSDYQQNFNTSLWYSSEVLINPVSFCGSYQLLGGISIGVSNSQFSYSLTDLPAHSKLYLYYTLFLIDQTQLDIYQYQLQVDNSIQLINFTIPSVLLTNECGGQQIDFVKPQKYNFNHNSSNVKITISIYKSFMGIRDFLFVVDNPTTDPNCISYSNSTKQCSECRYGLVVANSTCSSCLDGFYLDPKNSTLNCIPCPFTCKTCTVTNQTVKCTSCRDPLTLDGDYCIDASHNLFNAEILSTIQLASQTINFNYYPNLQKKGMDVCGSEEIIGTTTIKSKFLKMSRQYRNLRSHTGVYLYFTLYQIDDNYFLNNSLTFTLNSKVYTQENLTGISQYANMKTQLCGNSSWDNKFVIQLKDDSHTGDTLDFSINVNRMAKIGINNVQLYLMNVQASTATNYKIEIMPTYSVNTPPTKGIQVKFTFENEYVTIPNIDNAFTFRMINTEQASRLLQQSHSNSLVTENSTSKQKQLIYFLDLNQDYNDKYVLQVRPSSQNSVYFSSGAGQYNLISQAEVNTSMTRYVNVDSDSISNRSHLRNLFNLFRGCAILALFLGLGSFLFGMSAAFDDFFILCQLIFVHVFIQFNYNPPSILIPFSGLHIVQFLQWLPQQARIQIQKGIIPDTLYQATPLVFQQFFTDSVFARTIYHTILFFGLILGLWLLMHVCLLIYDSKFPNQKTKYQNFFVYFYKQYDSKKTVLVDKIVRFVYFTIVWACILQFLSFSNSPKSFHNWNSALTIIMFAFVIVYPMVMYYLLYKNANSLTDNTFGLAFEQIRVEKQSLYYYLIRYYKLFIIAIVVAATYNSSPVVPLIILIILNAFDVGFILRLKPLGMMQAELIQATIFYPLYPQIYHYTTVIQQFLFIVMQILFLIMVGIRSSGSSSAYMGVGYTICAFVILLLLNGLVRLVWGVLKIIQYCYLQRESNYLSIQKDMHEDPVDVMQIHADGRLQEQISKKLLTSTMNKRKPSYISQFR